MKLLYVLFSCLVLSGCVYQKQAVKKTSDSIQLMHESLARLSNIPDIPMHAVLKRVDNSAQNACDMQFACYYGGWTKQEVQSFYIEEMERFGWHLEGSYSGQETLLFFVSPNDQICSVMLHDTEFVVTVIKKEAC